MTHVEMDMGKAGFARQSDQRERLPGLDLIALPDHQAAAAQMTVPGGPAIAVGEANAVAALFAIDRLPAGLVQAHVGHAVAQGVDHARSRRAHLDARRHGREVADRDVGAWPFSVSPPHMKSRMPAPGSWST